MSFRQNILPKLRTLEIDRDNVNSFNIDSDHIIPLGLIDILLKVAFIREYSRTNIILSLNLKVTEHLKQTSGPLYK